MPPREQGTTTTARPQRNRAAQPPQQRGHAAWPQQRGHGSTTPRRPGHSAHLFILDAHVCHGVQQRQLPARPLLAELAQGEQHWGAVEGGGEGRRRVSQTGGAGWESGVEQEGSKDVAPSVGQKKMAASRDSRTPEKRKRKRRLQQRMRMRRRRRRRAPLLPRSPALRDSAARRSAGMLTRSVDIALTSGRGTGTTCNGGGSGRQRVPRRHK